EFSRFLPRPPRRAVRRLVLENGRPSGAGAFSRTRFENCDSVSIWRGESSCPPGSCQAGAWRRKPSCDRLRAMSRDAREAGPPPPKAASESRVTMTELVIPEDTNPTGNIFGGRVMALIDKAAAIVGLRNERTQVATASWDNH